MLCGARLLVHRSILGTHMHPTQRVPPIVSMQQLNSLLPCALQTTLMDVLAGRKTIGTITGDIRVNGFPKEQSTFAAIAGCEWG